MLLSKHSRRKFMHGIHFIIFNPHFHSPKHTGIHVHIFVELNYVICANFDKSFKPVFSKPFCSRTPFGFENNQGSSLLGHLNIVSGLKLLKITNLYPRTIF